MNPEALLALLRALARECLEEGPDAHDHFTMAQAFEDLDDALSRGARFPQEWADGQARRADWVYSLGSRWYGRAIEDLPDLSEYQASD